MNYVEAIRKVIIAEGGSKITNDKDDSGGLTKYGISQKSYPNLDIRNLTESQAIAIYKRDFWDKILGDQIKSYNVAYALFNQAVVRGVGAAVMTAQKVLGVNVDGGMGPMTLSKLNSISEKSFLERFLAESIQEAKDLVARRPKDAKFLDGWINRVNHIADYVGVKPATAVMSLGGLILVSGIFFLILKSRKRK